MLRKIKSIHILKIIFSHLIKALKLQIPKYNKSLQNKINLSINNYKEFTKRYIIYSSKESGKEYNENNELIYEGNFLNGKRNGIGKEYNDYKKIKFEGEFKNGKRNGKGKEFYYDKEIKFEGEYKNGYRWIGIEYDTDKNIKKK